MVLDLAESLTSTLILLVSIPEFGKIYVWFGLLEFTTNTEFKYEPSHTLILSNTAVPVESTGTVMSSMIQKVNDCLLKFEALSATGPALSVIIETLEFDASTEKLILHLLL